MKQRWLVLLVLCFSQTVAAEEAVSDPAAPAPPPVKAEDGAQPAEALPDETTPAPLVPGEVVAGPTGAAPLPPAAAGSLEKPSPAEPVQAEWTLTGAPGKGFTVSAGDAFSLNLKTRVLVRYQLNVPPEDEAGERKLSQAVSIGSLRLSLSGHVYDPTLTYVVQLALAAREYRDGSASPVYDAYLDWAVHRDFGVRVGQYFVPFDRLRTVSESALQLADRARPVAELALDRDVGVTLYSNSFLGDSSPLAWRLGVFGGGGSNLVQGKEPGALLVGRVELRPLGKIDDDSDGDLERRKKPGLAWGAGLARHWNSDRLRSTAGPTFTGGTSDYLHGALDLVFKWQGLGLQAEHLWKVASRDRITSTEELGEPRTEYTRSGRGWVLQASYVLGPPLEVVGRLSRMHAASGTDPSFVKEADTRAQEVAAGVSYYFKGHRLKLQGDLISRMSRDFDWDVADHVAHLQLDATF